MQAAIVLTTVSDPVLLDGYYENLVAHGWLDRVTVIVIPDRKTPPAAFERCSGLVKRGLRVVCPDLDEQEYFLRRVGFPPTLVPYDSDNRRNVGYLMALETGAELVISIDDDNYCSEGDFVGEHMVACTSAVEADVVEAATGWFNPSMLLSLEPDRTTYPRGFPYFARGNDSPLDWRAALMTVRINAGLWLDEPDLDALTWLVAPARARGFSGRSVVLGTSTWAPVNTQNTGLHRDVIPSYYFIPMGYELSGLTIDRYGDIFSGYFSQACAKHLGQAVRFGTPVAIHRRNAHDYLRDAARELGCIRVLEDLLVWLPEAKLQGKTYAEAYESLSFLLEDVVWRFTGSIWTESTRGYFHAMAYAMRQWVTACRRIG
jgi:hypothetical protein